MMPFWSTNKSLRIFLSLVNFKLNTCIFSFIWLYFFLLWVNMLFLTRPNDAHIYFEWINVQISCLSHLMKKWQTFSKHSLSLLKNLTEITQPSCGKPVNLGCLGIYTHFMCYPLCGIGEVRVLIFTFFHVVWIINLSTLKIIELNDWLTLKDYFYDCKRSLWENECILWA